MGYYLFKERTAAMSKSKKRYGNYNPLFVYTSDYYQPTLEDFIREQNQKLLDWERRQMRRGCAYKTKTTISGEMLESEIYLAFLNRSDYRRALKAEATGAAQKKQNDKNAQRKLIRYVHANFVPGDIFFTGGFSPDKMPATLQECKRFIVNYLNCLKYQMKRAGAGKLKYIYVVESVEKATGTAYHVHILMSKNAGANRDGMDGRDWVESKWKGGDYANTKSLQLKNAGGFTGISKYFTKQLEKIHDAEGPFLRRWGQSTNLKKWTKEPTESYSRFKKKRVISLLKAPATMKEQFEREYPGYQYLEDYPCEIRYSEIVDGYYLYCRMYRKRD